MRMEKIRQRRYKIASNVDRSSDERFSPVMRGLRGGNAKNEKLRNLPSLASDSSSCSSGATEADSFILELGWRPSKESFGAPVKKLLADEMSKETEIKKRSPCVIARLMGLEGMPSPRPAYDQLKCPSEEYSQSRISKEKAERRGTNCDRQMSRRSSKDQQEFKDVFEVLETSKIAHGTNSDHGNAKFKVTESEMAFIRQKFMDAKRLSTDEKLHGSREFHDALDVLQSNRDLLLKFLHQPGSLFARHLHDLQDAGSHSGRGCLAGMESGDHRKFDCPESRDKSERGTPRKNSTKSNYNQRDGHSLKSSQILERENELEHFPTRIVVLKPNIGKVQNASNIIFPAHSLPVRSGLEEFRTVERRNKEYRGKKKSHEKEVLSRHSYKESSDVANGITGDMRNGFSTPHTNLRSSNFQGYAGDESSCSLSGNESAEESIVRTVNPKSFSNLNIGNRRSSSRHKESSISREAKKRLTDRWKSTRKSEDKGVVGRGSTLADMLAAHDKEVTLAHLDARMTEKRFTDTFSNDEQPARGVEPLGISSNEGWKHDYSQLTKSRSLPASSIGSGSPKAMHLSNNTHGTDKNLLSKGSEPEKNKAAKKIIDQRERLLCQKSTSSKVKSVCLLPTSRENNRMLLQIPVNKKCIETDFLDDSSSEMTFTDFEASFSNVDDRSPIPQIVEDVRDGYTIGFPEAPDDLHSELSDHVSTSGHFCSRDQEILIPEEGQSEGSSAPSHKSVAALRSPASSKDADQPSPVSVLETAFRDDLSSCSECFESVSTDLQGLRMQLHLLKLESEACAEGSMLIFSDEDAGEGSVGPSEENGLCKAKYSWELYFFDILIDSGLDDTNPDVFIATWYSSDCPINPTIFDELEKKQSYPTSTRQSDRRLLFDRINSGIMAISRPFTDPHPWVRPPKTQIATKWTMKDGLQNSLCKFLETQEKQIDRDENDIADESEWQDLGDEIDVIGKEIERLMIDELLAEVVVM